MRYTYRNSANLPLRVAVIDRDMPGNDAWKMQMYTCCFQRILAVRARSQSTICLPCLLESKIKTVCQLAEANIQPGRLLPDAVHSAAGRELVKITSTDDGPKSLD